MVTLQKGNFFMQKNQKITTRTLVVMSLLIGLNIIIVRFLSYETPILRVDFGYLTNACAAMLLGPVLGGVTAALSDVIGMLVSGKIATYFPGFTFNAFLYGFLYGVFLYKKEHTITRISVCVITTIFSIGMFLTPIWLYILSNYVYGSNKAFFIFLSSNVIKNLVMIPVQIVSIKFVSRYLLPNIKGSIYEK